MYEQVNEKHFCEEYKNMPNMINECNDDYSCLENARKYMKICDCDPSCFGISWLIDGNVQMIGKCLSRKMKPNREGWRTIMKSTKGKLSINRIRHEGGKNIPLCPAQTIH